MPECANDMHDAARALHAIKARIFASGTVPRMDSDVDLALQKAAAHIDDEAFDAALDAFDAVLAQDPGNTAALLDKGVILQNQGHVSRAIACFDSVLEVSPHDFGALLNKGSALHAAGRYADAISCYDLILDARPRSPTALLHKGLSLGELGDLGGAIEHFDHALRIDAALDAARVSADEARRLLAMRGSS